ncbi:hypothetical protein CEXT_355561 [Caerostris extrusa]|uniref:Uncharacterized protein n=1 Tax=Caerostris extrusa TaxID=172846 RepID=A0AAV4RKJ0_CAEEX|nr:hypothetical protein CEXT_355561 [Caerostris extrusa]
MKGNANVTGIMRPYYLYVQVPKGSVIKKRVWIPPIHMRLYDPDLRIYDVICHEGVMQMLVGFSRLTMFHNMSKCRKAQWIKKSMDTAHTYAIPCMILTLEFHDDSAMKGNANVGRICRLLCPYMSKCRKVYD